MCILYGGVSAGGGGGERQNRCHGPGGAGGGGAKAAGMLPSSRAYMLYSLYGFAVSCINRPRY